MSEHTIGQSLRRRLAAAFLMLAVLSTGFPGYAAENKGSAGQDALSIRIAELEKIEPLEEPYKTELSLLRKAQLFLKKTQESQAQAAQWETLIAAVPDKMKQLNKKLAQPMGKSAAFLPADTTLEDLQQKLEQARTELSQAQAQRNKVEDEDADIDNRRRSIPAEINTARKRIADIRAEQSAPAPAAAQLSDARQMAREAELSFLQQSVTEKNLELRAYDVQRDYLLANKQWVEREVLTASSLASRLEVRLAALRSRLAEQTLQSAEQEQQASATSYPVLRAIAQQNARMAEELSRIAADTAAKNADKKEIEDKRRQIEKSFAAMKEKLAQVGLTDALGLRLRNQLVILPDIYTIERRTRKRHDELNRVQLRRMELEDDLLALVDPTLEAQRLLAAAGGVAPENRQKLLNAIERDLAKQKSDYLESLVKAYDTYFSDVLIALQESDRQLLEITGAYHKFLSERILWVQSAPPLKAYDIPRIANTLVWLLDIRQWHTTAMLLLKSLWHHPFNGLLLATLFGVLWFLRGRMKQAMVGYADTARRYSKAKFQDTLLTLAMTILLAAVWPWLLWAVSMQLALVEDSEFTLALSAGLERAAIILFAAAMLRVMCRPLGLAEAHFFWSPAALKLTRYHLHWFTPLVVSSAFVFAITDAQTVEAYRDSLGRLAFIVAMVAITVFMRQVLHPEKAVLHPIISAHTGGWLDRLKIFWFPLVVAAPLALAWLAAFGYFYSAWQLENRLLLSAALIFGVIVIHAMVVRWLNLEQHKLALEQARKKQQARTKQKQEQEKAESAPAQDILSDTAEINISDEMIDVSALSEQTRKLSRSVVLITVFVGLYLIWKDVLPAFGILKEVELWEVTVAGVTQTDGQTVKEAISITLADLGEAVVILLATIVIGKNIPGLLEMAILQRLPFTPSGRYAIIAITRYAIVIIGLISTFGVIGIGWSKVQFLAAAVTVGLGFGLQEIFANFVSGLIILFERQVRVGDIVTIGSISGKVTRIRMRATTITDWNRKELIIPNKEFVTGQVVNWSLSDPVLRLDIPVGVAYGSDTELVTVKLLEAAERHPKVYKDPPPVAVFLGFGESTLQFELRVFIHYDDLVAVRHDLHMSIDKSFRTAAIEIAFPQRDIRIRSIDAQSIQNLQARKQE